MAGETVPDLLKLLSDYGGTGGLAASAAIGVFGWLGQRYLAFLTDWLTLDTRGVKVAKILKDEISQSIENYEAEFTKETKDATVALAKQKHKSKSKAPRHLLLVSSAGGGLMEQIEKGTLDLPVGVTVAALRFASAEDLFDKCYALLGSIDFAASDWETKEKCIDDCYSEADNCIRHGKAVIKLLDQQIDDLNTNRVLLLASNIVFAFVLLSWFLPLIKK
jgi:hypothetical protein